MDGISPIVSVLNGTYTVGNFFLQLHDAPEELRDAVQLLAEFQHDLQEATELLHRKFSFSDPDLNKDLSYRLTQGAITGLQLDVDKISKHIKADVRESRQERHSIPMANRFEWVAGGKSKYTDLRATLIARHLKLMTARNEIQSRPDVEDTTRSPSVPYTDPRNDNDSDDTSTQFLSPDASRRLRGRSTELISPGLEDSGYRTASASPEQPRGSKRKSKNEDDDDPSYLSQYLSPDARRRWRGKSTEMLPGGDDVSPGSPSPLPRKSRRLDRHAETGEA